MPADDGKSGNYIDGSEALSCAKAIPGPAEIDRLLLELEHNLESAKLSLKRARTCLIFRYVN